MSGPFQSGSSSQDLSGPPWNVTETISVYVQNIGGHSTVYTDAAATIPFEPPEFHVERGTSTGIYAFIAASSDAGTKFTDGIAGRPLPVSWDDGSPPPTVTYGKIQSDRLAFSMKDEWNHKETKKYEFDIHLELPDGTITRMSLGVDPVIIEAEEIPPDEDDQPI